MALDFWWGAPMADRRMLAGAGIPWPSVPLDRPVAVLLRHAERPPIPPDEAGSALELTATGSARARALGAALGMRLLSLRTSPIRRCVQTAEAMARGARQPLEPALDHTLGDPGVFVADPEAAWQNWVAWGNSGVMRRLASGQQPLVGMHDPDAAAGRLLRHLSDGLHQAPGLHAFVTHDAVLLPFVARLGARALEPEPAWLEAAAVWRDARGLVLAWRDELIRGLPGCL